MHERFAIADLPCINFTDGHSQPRGNVLHRLAAIPDDADALGHGLGRYRVIAGHHDHLHAGRVTLIDRFRHGRPRRIDRRDHAQEPELGVREILLVGVERKLRRRIVADRKALVADADESFAQAADPDEGVVERLPPGAVDALFATVDQDRRAAIKNPLRRAEHRQLIVGTAMVVHQSN